MPMAALCGIGAHARHSAAYQETVRVAQMPNSSALSAHYGGELLSGAAFNNRLVPVVAPRI